MLATGGGVTRIWDSQTGSQLAAFGLSETSVYTKLAWPNLDTFISLETGYGEDATTIVRFWDIATGKVLMEFQGGENQLWQ
jgi:WD40 repeat protein